MGNSRLEKEFRSKIVEMLKPLRAFPVENDVHDGTPDVCCTAGWIELKVGDSPKRATTPLSLGLRPAQGVFLRMWRRAGGRAWGLILVDDTYVMLHDGLWAADNYDNVAGAVLMGNAIYVEKLNSPKLAIGLIDHLLQPLPRRG